MPLSLSVLVVNYNGDKFIKETISSFFEAIKNRKFEVEMLILDNNSTDNSTSVLSEIEREAKWPVKFYYGDDNIGFAKGCNFLAKEASNDVVFLLNNDTKTLCLDKFCHLLENEQLDNNAIGTVKILNNDLTIQNNIFSFPSKLKLVLELFLLKHKLVSLIGRKNTNITADTDFQNQYFSGCVLFLPRKLYLDFNGFDQRFYFYHEECDLFMRLDASGEGVKKVYLEDEIVHFGGGGGEISDFAFVAYYENLFRLFFYNTGISYLCLSKLFKIAFKFRNFLSKMGIGYRYSPFSTTYKGLSNRSSQDVLKLNERILDKIQDKENFR
ncbi:glycosyltransferase [Pseudoalteromonas sp. S4498]|uniref:glycosyltransferase n=1 Tax=Pseudoalteromonas galatheae TaxID=579562 RepID=UPI00110806D7|nr:glycosyltransferase [Pseudoalteromonas galatheae]NKC17456.1 glycosyltransferase [Pseudoalteromonas galatheae]